MGIKMERGNNVRQFILQRLSRSRIQILSALGILFILYLLTPYDSPIRAAFRFQHTVVDDYLQHKFPSDAWLFKNQKYPIDPDSDVGIIVKTGFGTRHRVPKLLAALGNETMNNDMIVLQDHPMLAHENFSLPNGKNVPAVDIIGWMLATKQLQGKEHVERVTKYLHLAEAIEAEEWFVSDGLSKEIGWEMDAMKFISGFQYAWKTMPKKKWYVMIDDDTYLIKESLNLALGHLNPAKPQYLGNPVGDYKGRFAHGGSSAIVSAAAMSKLFDRRPDIVAAANLEAPTAIWGDKLLAETLMKIGVYLDESYSRLFNGEPPHMTRMWADRFCIPLTTFHGLGSGDALHQVGNTFKSIREPVFWRQLGSIYGAAAFDTFVAEPIRINTNFVGRLDDRSTTVENVKTVEECLATCQRRSSDCLAWTWAQNTKQCFLAPWALIGDAQDGVFSGINAKLAMKLADRCHSPPAPVIATE